MKTYQCKSCGVYWEEEQLMGCLWCHCGGRLKPLMAELIDPKRKTMMPISIDEILDFHEQCPTTQKEENIIR